MCHHVCCYHPCTASTEADRIICRVGQRVYSLFPLIKLHVNFSFIRLYGFPAFLFLQHCTTPPFVVSLFRNPYSAPWIFQTEDGKEKVIAIDGHGSYVTEIVDD